jgi:hypothetical protein
VRSIADVKVDTPTVKDLRERRARRLAGRYFTARVPFGLLEQAEQARALYLFLRLFAECRVRHAAIRLGADRLAAWNVSRHAVYRALSRLEAAGLVVVERQVGRALRVSVPAAEQAPE